MNLIETKFKFTNKVRNYLYKIYIFLLFYQTIDTLLLDSHNGGAIAELFDLFQGSLFSMHLKSKSFNFLEK